MNKSETDAIKNYIKERFELTTLNLYFLGEIIFEKEKSIAAFYDLLKTKNKYFQLNSFGHQIVLLDRCHNFICIFKLDWFLNILVKNEKFVEYLYGEI